MCCAIPGIHLQQQTTATTSNVKCHADNTDEMSLSMEVTINTELQQSPNSCRNFPLMPVYFEWSDSLISCSCS